MEGQHSAKSGELDTIAGLSFRHEKKDGRKSDTIYEENGVFDWSDRQYGLGRL